MSETRFYASGLPRCPCGKPATHAVRGPYNADYGVVCDRCRKRRLRELEESWKEIPLSAMARK
jgi:hypothetical protein